MLCWILKLVNAYDDNMCSFSKHTTMTCANFLPLLVLYIKKKKNCNYIDVIKFQTYRLPCCVGFQNWWMHMTIYGMYLFSKHL